MAEGLAGESNASPQEIAQYYDAWAKSGYDDDVVSWGYEAPEIVAAQIAGHVEDAESPVLDAGCGTGRVGAALYAQGLRNVTGGDFTPASVEAARARGIYRSVDHLDLNGALAFSDERFAAVASVGVFSYISGVEATLRELVRITRVGGIIVFTQRTDLWAERGCAAIIGSLCSEGFCTAEMSEPQPYLPEHPEFSTEIGIIYTTLTSIAPGVSRMR